MKSTKPKRGRPPLPPEQKRVTVHMTLPQATVERARQIGDGNVSAGVEIAVRRARVREIREIREIREERGVE